MFLANLDGKPVPLSLVQGRPSIALAAAFLLDSSASPQVRDAVANAPAEGIRGVDVNRDSVAIVSTADTTRWDQANFTTSADDLKQRLNQIIRTTSEDTLVTLEQVAGVLRAECAAKRYAGAEQANAALPRREAPEEDVSESALTAMLNVQPGGARWAALESTEQARRSGG